MKRVFEELEDIKAELTEQEARVEQAKAKLKLKQLKWDESREKAFAEVPEEALWHYDVCGKRLWFTSEHMLRFPESIFAVRASGRWKEKDVVRLDRNPQVFKLVAKALWTGEVDARIPQDELDFYGIPEAKEEVSFNTAGWRFSEADGSIQGNIFRGVADKWNYALGPLIRTKKTWFVNISSPFASFDIGIKDETGLIGSYASAYSVHQYSVPHGIGYNRVECITGIKMVRNDANCFKVEYCPNTKRLIIEKDGKRAVEQVISCANPCLYLGLYGDREMMIKEV